MSKKPTTEMMEDLGRSDLCKADATRLKYKALTPAETEKITGKEVPSYRIPYTDVNGKETKFYRIKFLGKVKEGFSSKKTIKYWQPPATLPGFYLPNMVGIRWKKVQENTGLDIVITEGEKKAARVCKAGYPCIGIGGVWSWKSTKRGLPSIPDFDAFEWGSRKVYLCFDSDMYSNPMVVQALYALSMELLNRGAHVHVIPLEPESDPHDPTREFKVGVDDYIALHGESAFRSLIENKADEFKPSSVLWQLNEELAYIKGMGAVLEISTGLMHRRKDSLVNLSFANREYEFADGTKIVAKNSAAEWLKWTKRRTHNAFDYRPGEDAIVDDNVLNMWRGWGCEPEDGDVGLFLQLLEHLFKGAPDAMEWFLNWLAYPLQYPGTKMQQAAVIWSTKQGVGKSTIGYVMSDIYGRNFQKVTQRELHSSFNGWLTNKQFILGEEIVGTDSRRDRDQLKELITQQRVYVNEKFQPAYDVDDRANYYFTSNHADAVFVDRYDRRFFVHEVTVAAKPRTFYGKLERWRRNGGAAHLFAYLLERDLGNFSPYEHALLTDSKKAMIDENRSDIEEFCARLREDPDHILQVDKVKADRDLFTLKELRFFLPEHILRRNPTSTALGRALRREGFVCFSTRTLHGVKKLWAIRNREKWERAGTKDRVKHYEQSAKFTEHGHNLKKFRGE